MECDSGSCQSIGNKHISAPEDDADNCSEEHEEVAHGDSDSDTAMDEVQSSENHSSKCHLDYRLLTFQDMGRYIYLFC